MAKKEVNARRIVMDIVLVLVLIIGIILLFAEFGTTAGSLSDIDGNVANNSNKIANVENELNNK